MTMNIDELVGLELVAAFARVFGYEIVEHPETKTTMGYIIVIGADRTRFSYIWRELPYGENFQPI